MLAFPAVTAGIIGIFFQYLEMTSYFFGNGGWILANLLGDLLERHSIPKAGLDDDTFAEG
jgi:hypothetical protein